jgi:hypothetical protein
MLKLIRNFPLASLVCVLLAIVILGGVYRQAATTQILELGERSNVALAQIFANSLWPQYRSFAEAAGRVDADRLRTHPDIAKLREAVASMMRGTQVIKVKLYENEGRTLFSTDPAQIGKDYSANPGFLSARKGRPASELTHRAKFSAFDGELEDRDVLSSYVALRAGPDAPIEGVLEIYTDVTDLLAGIEQQLRLMTLIVVGVLTALYAALLFIARRGGGLTRREHSVMV